MVRERDWVFEIKKEYICKLLKEAESKSGTKHYLKNGLKTLSKLQNGDHFVTEKAIKSVSLNICRSPSAGLYAWLDEFSGKLGAGIVEKGIENNLVAFKIRKEFYGAVQDVLKGFP